MIVGIIYGGSSIESDYSREAFQHIKEIFKNDKEVLIQGIELNDYLNENISKNIIERVDIFMSIVYGNPGQDGSIQGILNLNRCYYLGSDILANAIIKNKKIMKDFVSSKNINTAKYLIIDNKLVQEEQILKYFESSNLKLPVVIKPNNMGGLSLGITYVDSLDKLYEAIKYSQIYDTSVLIEEYIEGTEVTVSEVWLDERYQVLNPIVIEKQSKLSDYYAKKNNLRKLKFDSQELTYDNKKKLVKTTQKIFSSLNMKDYGYFDYIIDNNNEIYFIEAGAVPGFTKGSNIPNILSNSNRTLKDFLLQLFKKNFMEKENEK